MEKWKKKSVQVFLVAVIISVISAVPHKSSVLDSSYRLPKSLVPLSYELSIKSEVHIEGDTNFGGTVKIKVEVLDDTDVVTLHSSGLIIEKPMITYSNGTTIDQARSYDFDVERDFLKIYPSNLLISGQIYFLEIKFSGNLKTTTTSAFYRSQYQVASEIEPRYELIRNNRIIS